MGFLNRRLVSRLPPGHHCRYLSITSENQVTDATIICSSLRLGSIDINAFHFDIAFSSGKGRWSVTRFRDNKFSWILSSLASIVGSIPSVIGARQVMNGRYQVSGSPNELAGPSRRPLKFWVGRSVIIRAFHFCLPRSLPEIDDATLTDISAATARLPFIA